MCSESLKRSDKMLLHWFTLMLTLWKSKKRMYLTARQGEMSYSVFHYFHFVGVVFVI